MGNELGIISIIFIEKKTIYLKNFQDLPMYHQTEMEELCSVQAPRNKCLK
jgi:hypothetical protein